MKTSTSILVLGLMILATAIGHSGLSAQDAPQPGTEFPVKGGELDSLILANLAAINPDSIKNTMQQLQNMGTRFMLAPNRREVAQWLKERFESVGCGLTVIDSFMTQTFLSINNTVYDTVTWQYNVSAVLPGHVNPDKITLIGGHYDCFTMNDPMNLAPGADDNASSVAVVIELARVIANSGFPHNRTIRFLALGAEELMYYSTVSGARDYAGRCAAAGEDIQLYINNDMIAHEPSAGDWIIDYIVHDAAYWTTALTVQLAGDYTVLSANILEEGNSGADDLPFWQAGYQTGYFFEHNFCPYYHSEDDVVDNCNIAYCAEVARLNMALLLSVTEMPQPVGGFFLYATGDGSSLQAVWSPSDESDIAEYTIRLGTDPGALNEVHTTEDTTFLFTGLEEGALYFASITAMNTGGTESTAVLKRARPAVVTLDQGILVVAGSEGGLLDPPQETIDQFYAGMLHNFQYGTMDATSLDEIKLSEIGAYSTVLWHIDDPGWTSDLLSVNGDVLRNYLWLGGNFMFTGFRPSRNFGSADNQAPFRKGSFMYDCLKISAGHNDAARLFAGGIPEMNGWPEVYVDSLKMPVFSFHLPWVEVFEPADDGTVAYRYDTRFDTTTVQGSYYNRPVAIIPAEDEKNTFVTSFPLYYMDSLQSRQLVYTVMTQLFGEDYLGTEEHRPAGPMVLTAFPNPARGAVTFEFAEPVNRVVICLMDASGKETIRLQSDPSGRAVWDTRDVPAGLYLFRAVAGSHAVAGKVLVMK